MVCVGVWWNDANLMCSEVVETSIRRVMGVDLWISIVWGLNLQVRSGSSMDVDQDKADSTHSSYQKLDVNHVGL